MILTSGVLGLSLGKFDDYGAFLFLNNSGGATTAYVTSGIGGSGVPLFAERSASQLMTYTGGLSAPPASFGFSGDYAVIPTGNYRFFGPKPSDTGSWGLGMDLIISGATGLMGPTGLTGPAGSGLISGGISGNVLAKKSGTNQDTEWVDVIDLLNFNKGLSMQEYPETSNPILLKDANGENILAGAGITYSKFTSNFYIPAADGGTIYVYSASFKYVISISVPFITGSISSIDWQSGTTFVISVNSGSSSPRIHKIQILDHLAIYVAESIINYNTGLPASMLISGVCIDKNDNVYFCQRDYYSGVWGIYKTDLAMSPLQIFDINTCELNNDISYSTPIFEDILINETTNSLICLINQGSQYGMYEIDLKTVSPINKFRDSGYAETVHGISTLQSGVIFDSSNSLGFCFREDCEFLYVSSYTPSFGCNISAFQKNSKSIIVFDTLDKKNHILSDLGLYHPIEIKTFQTYETNTNSLSSTQFNFSTSNYFGKKDISQSRLFPSTEIRVEAYGVVTTNKQFSLFPKNHGDTPPSSDNLNSVTGSYFLQLPSGLSGVSWRYMSEMSVLGFNSTGSSLMKKSLYANFEVFSNPKLELFYCETGLCDEMLLSPLDLRFNVSSSGSGSITLYNQKIIVR